MKYILDCHAHTISSGHAYSTVNEYAIEASKKGLELIAITDHAPTMPGSTHEYHFHNIKVLPKTLHGVEILKGAEVNILDANGTLDMDTELLRKLDLNIASIHPPCYRDLVDEHITDAYLNVMEHPYIDIIGHPDDGRFPVDYEKFTKKASETGTIIEMNNSSLSPNSFREKAKENYTELLKYCEKYRVPIIINSDSHFHTYIGEFPYAIELIKALNFDESLIINDSVEKLKQHLKSRR